MEQRVQDIIRAAQCGEEGAFTELYGLYAQSVYAKAITIMHNEADAKDIVQEVFIEVHRALSNLREVESFYSWLMMITVNKCNVHFRKQRFLSKQPLDEKQSHQQPDARVYMNPQLSVHNRSEREILIEMIDSLTPKQSEILRMMYLEEMKLQEIADVLGVPLGTVKTRSVRAREELRKKLEAFEKQEGYQLHFHMDALLPMAILSTSILQTMKSKAVHLYEFASSNMAMSACALSFSVLAISGGAFLYQDAQTPEVSDTQPPKQELISNPSMEESAKEEPVLRQASFQPTTYQEASINTIQEAYYTCLNFGKDEDALKQIPEEEFQDIIPIYEQLKNSGSPYYTKLVNSGWSALFEQFAYQ